MWVARRFLDDGVLTVILPCKTAWLLAMVDHSLLEFAEEAGPDGNRCYQKGPDEHSGGDPQAVSDPRGRPSRVDRRRGGHPRDPRAGRSYYRPSRLGQRRAAPGAPSPAASRGPEAWILDRSCWTARPFFPCSRTKPARIGWRTSCGRRRSICPGSLSSRCITSASRSA